MSISYQSVLERLKRERKNKHLSQSEIGRVVRMSQSHYSKAENGTRRFSYFEVQCLCESEIDSYYVLTGKKCICNYSEYWKECVYEELLYFYDIICMTIEYFYFYGKHSKFKETYEGIKYVRDIIAWGKANGNIFYNLRKILGYNQHKMAETIEVDVKKLRELEKGKVLPDSEIIWKMYCLYNIPPAILVKSKIDLAYTIDDLLSVLEPQLATFLVAYLEQLHELGKEK